MIWRFGSRRFDLTRRALVMGVVNVTPDSFSDGGRFADPGVAVAHGLKLAADGADILDIGGESSRPGAREVSAEEEMARVLPVVRGLRDRSDVPISVDTWKASVAEACLGAGADIVNDITALCGDATMVSVVAESGAGVVLMHMRGTPRTMQSDTTYADLIGEISDFLGDRLAGAIRAGIASEAVVLDPGIGFGKSVDQNFEIIARVGEFARHGRPVLSGPSRKSFLRKTVFGPEGGPVSEDDERIMEEATIVATTASILNGARIIRVHDAARGDLARRLCGRITDLCGADSPRNPS